MRTNETGRARGHDPIRPSGSESLAGIVPSGGAADLNPEYPCPPTRALAAIDARSRGPRTPTPNRRKAHRERVYVASPISTYQSPRYGRALWYQSPRYGRALDLIAAHHPGAELLPARSLYADSFDWVECWPAILATLDRLVYFTAEDRTIGAGVAREVTDVAALGLPIHLLDGNRLRDHARVTWRWLPAGDRARVTLVLQERGVGRSA